jgi:hypothetical protein
VATQRTVLTAGFAALAIKLQEASAGLSATDTASRLRDALDDAHRGTGSYASYITHYDQGDGSGEVHYLCDGDEFMAPYEIHSDGDSAPEAAVDTGSRYKVKSHTVTKPVSDEADHYAMMEESEKLITAGPALYWQTPEYQDFLALMERYISKSERTSADASDFAGKGKSFPILKPEDVMAAVRSMGRAGSANLGPSGIKARIIAIAKRKGWTKYLPKSWQGGDDAKEGAAGTRAPGTLELVESAATLEPIVLKEARSDYEIKLIAPGRGSSAVYPAEVLKRDGPRVFKSGTHVYLNHPTAAEEAARPEGDVKNLAGVLTTDAQYHEAHAKGPGLYARMKVFADHAQTVEEKAPHVGMSIRAAGIAESNKTEGGLPVLKELSHAESVDVVTRAGAGGLILTEAARPANSPNQEDSADMDAEQLKKLQETVTAQAALNARLLERAIKGDAREQATRILKTTTLIEAARERVVESVLRDVPIKDGALDTEAFTTRVNEAAKAEGAYVASIMGSGRVTGMGAPVVPIDAKEAERKAEERKQLRESRVKSYMDLGLPKAAAEAAADRDEQEAA